VAYLTCISAGPGYALEEYQGTEELETDLSAAAVPAGLHGFLFHLKQQLVRELIAAVWLHPDGSGALELRADGSRIPLQVRVSRPKGMAKSI